MALEAVIALCPGDDRHADGRVFERVPGGTLRLAMACACTAAGVPAFHPYDLRPDVPNAQSAIMAIGPHSSSLSPRAGVAVACEYSVVLGALDAAPLIRRNTRRVGARPATRARRLDQARVSVKWCVARDVPLAAMMVNVCVPGGWRSRQRAALPAACAVNVTLRGTRRDVADRGQRGRDRVHRKYERLPGPRFQAAGHGDDR